MSHCREPVSLYPGAPGWGKRVGDMSKPPSRENPRFPAAFRFDVLQPPYAERAEVDRLKLHHRSALRRRTTGKCDPRTTCPLTLWLFPHVSVQLRKLMRDHVTSPKLEGHVQAFVRVGGWFGWGYWREALP